MCLSAVFHKFGHTLYSLTASKVWDVYAPSFQFAVLLGLFLKVCGLRVAVVVFVVPLLGGFVLFSVRALCDFSRFK